MFVGAMSWERELEGVKERGGMGDGVAKRARKKRPGNGENGVDRDGGNE